MSAASDPERYKNMTGAEFTERHPVTLQQFYLWSQWGRPVVHGLPLICEDHGAYAAFWHMVRSYNESH